MHEATLFFFWRSSLKRFLTWFENVQASSRYFYAKIFVGFVIVNLGCFWWALLTAYPGHLLSAKAQEHILIGFPVSFLGAIFDSLSLLVTLLMIRRALTSNSNLVYLGFLSIDILIAILATFWVLFAFVVSGWLVSFVLAIPETMNSRTTLYQGRLADLFSDPFGADNLRNVYSGVIMGASALLPTLFHLFLAGKSWVMTIMLKLQSITSDDYENAPAPASKSVQQLNDGPSA